METCLDQVSPIARLHVPWGSQEIELQEVRFEAGGAPLMRVRIREGRRFTIFDIDAVTARQWGQAMQGWADAQIEGSQGA